MYKLCKTETSAKRQRMLEEGLLSVMSRQQYEDISVSRLCEQLHISRKVFYRYFSGKEGALHALLEHNLMECLSYLRDNDRQGIGGYQDLESFFCFWKDKKLLLDALAYSNLTGMLVERVLDMTMKEINPLGKFIVSESDYMQRHMVRFCICGIMVMVLNWHREGYSESPAQMAQVAVKLLTSPLIKGNSLRI